MIRRSFILVVFMYSVVVALVPMLPCRAVASMQRDSADYSKMSSLVRRAAMEQRGIGSDSALSGRAERGDSAFRFSRRSGAVASAGGRHRELCAFVLVDGAADADSVFAAHNSRPLARFGNIHIVSVPLGELRSLSVCRDVSRIEAGRSCTALMDTVAACVNALPVYAGTALPQAYTGRDVVMGVMDIGFDLTHPNFYDMSGTDYRIKCLWDQLSADTVGRGMYVGACYEGRDALLGYAHSRDGLLQTHGTHTLGIAAGSGGGGPYRGMAWESDICLVSNAVTSDIPLIDEADLYKYTYATDALGFKYIFDYADAVGKPCVISFSEGSHQDLRGDDVLYYEVLSDMVGPGRILVASAGNEGHLKTFVNKSSGQAFAGSFASSSSNSLYLTMSASADFTLRVVAYGGTANDTVCIPLQAVVSSAGGEYADTVRFAGRECVVEAAAYASCYDSSATACDFQLRGLSASLDGVVLSVELLGMDADVDMYLVSGALYDSALNPQLCHGRHIRSIHSPSSAPSVICVGATVYRTGFTNYLGDRYTTNIEGGGVLVDYSSRGPTADGRVKPDVVAPGSNVVSSYSSYYIEANPNARDLLSTVCLSDVAGRVYPWTSNAGTSMSAPVVGGAVALWLQARPDLTPADVMGVISRTSRRLDSVHDVPNNEWGYGEIDVHRGLLDILGISAIDGVTADVPRGVELTWRDGRLYVVFSEPPAVPVTLRVCTLGGAVVAERNIEAGGCETVEAVPLTYGSVYAVVLSSSDTRLRGTLLLRAGN